MIIEMARMRIAGPRRQLEQTERRLLNQMYPGGPSQQQVATYLKANPTAPTPRRVER